MIKALLLMGLLIWVLPVLHAQQISASKPFNYKKQFLIHELQWAKPVSGDAFILLQEQKKFQFNLIKYTRTLQVVWQQEIKVDKNWNVPQLFINRDTVLLLSYNIEKKPDLPRVKVKYFSLSDGSLLKEAGYDLVKFSRKGGFPRFVLSPNLQKIAIYNYANISELAEVSVFNLFTGQQEVTYEPRTAINDDDMVQNVFLENDGDLLYVYADPTFFKMAALFFKKGLDEPLSFETGMVFTRPIDGVERIIINRSGPKKYRITASGSLKDDLIGIKLAEYDFDNYQVVYDTIQSFNIQYFYYLYQKEVRANPRIKKSTLKEPWRLKNFHLQQLLIDQYGNSLVTLEKSLREPEYYLPHNNENLDFIYNTGRKLQRSEDIIIMCFDPEGQLYWDHVLQKHQVTRPFNFYMSYVSGLDQGVLNLLSWSKKGKNRLFVNSIHTRDGSFIRKQLPVLPDSRYTYHKNYSCWLDSNTLVITSQKRNKRKNRTLQVIDVAD